jgi:guanine deaminase
MLAAIRNASFCSKLVAMEHTEHTSLTEGEHELFSSRQLSVGTLLFLATLGGAQVCNLTERIGNFEPNKDFDALLVSLRPETRNPNIWIEEEDLQPSEGEKDEEKIVMFLEKFLFCGDDRNVLRVWVAGRLVGGCELNV